MDVCEKTISAGSKNLPPRASPQHRRRQHCMRACSDTAYGSACEGSFQCQGQERTIRVQICPVVVQNCSGRGQSHQLLLWPFLPAEKDSGTHAEWMPCQVPKLSHQGADACGTNVKCQNWYIGSYSILCQVQMCPLAVQICTHLRSWWRSIFQHPPLPKCLAAYPSEDGMQIK